MSTFTRLSNYKIRERTIKLVLLSSTSRKLSLLFVNLTKSEVTLSTPKVNINGIFHSVILHQIQIDFFNNQSLYKRQINCPITLHNFLSKYWKWQCFLNIENDIHNAHFKIPLKIFEKNLKLCLYKLDYDVTFILKKKAIYIVLSSLFIFVRNVLFHFWSERSLLLIRIRPQTKISYSYLVFNQWDYMIVNKLQGWA